jgi:hypothetical protein
VNPSGTSITKVCEVDHERAFFLAWYSEEPPSSQEEEELLTQLVNACFGSSETENEELLRDVMALSRAQGQCKESGVAAGNIRAVSRNVVEAVKDLKRQVESHASTPHRQGTGSVSLRIKGGSLG